MQTLSYFIAVSEKIYLYTILHGDLL